MRTYDSTSSSTSALLWPLGGHLPPTGSRGSSDGPATRHQEIYWTWEEDNEILPGVADQGWTVDMVLQRTVPWWRWW